MVPHLKSLNKRPAQSSSYYVGIDIIISTSTSTSSLLADFCETTHIFVSMSRIGGIECVTSCCTTVNDDLKI